MMLRLIGASILVLLSGCIFGGCAQTREDIVMDMARSIALKVVDKAKLDQTTLNAQGKIVNPQYRYTFFGGMGVGSFGEVQAVGVNVDAGVSASGLGEGMFDADLREKINKILTNKIYSQQDRRDKITEAVIEWLTTKAEQAATTQPAKE